MKPPFPILLFAFTAWIVPFFVGTALGGEMTFTDVTLDAGIVHTHTPPAPFDTGAGLDPAMSWTVGGAAAEDFTGDGWIDLFVFRGSEQPSRLYVNNRDGTFTDEAQARGAALSTIAGSGAAAADYDNDGDIDLVAATEFGPHVLLVNEGTGTFVADMSTLQQPSQFATSPSWGDVDNDGFLELVLGEWDKSVAHAQSLYLYRNIGGTSLQSYAFTPNPAQYSRVFSPRFADFNEDGYSDLAVAADSGRSQLFFNQGDGTYSRVTVPSHVDGEEDGRGAAIADFDNDGDLDWFVSGVFDAEADETFPWDGSGNRLYQNNGQGVFRDFTETTGLRDGNWGWGAAFGDLDNDGDLDLFQVNGWSDTALPFESNTKFDNQPARLFENQGGLRFNDVASDAGADHTGQGRGAILFDFDNDGDLDIFITNNHALTFVGETPARVAAPPVLLRNDTDNENHRLIVHLAGIPPLHRNGIGSRAYVTADGVTRMREAHASTGFMAQGPGRIAHFGLGSATEIEEVRAEWNNGDTTILFGIAPDGVVSVTSPMATISNRIPDSGESVTFNGADVPPLGNPREWRVDGTAFADPLATSFVQAGTKEVFFDLFDLDGTTLLRREVFRFEVQGEIPTPTPTPTDSDTDPVFTNTPTHTPTEGPSPTPTETPTQGPTEAGTPTPTPTPTLVSERSDVNGDGRVDSRDILIIELDWQKRTEVHGDSR